MATTNTDPALVRRVAREFGIFDDKMIQAVVLAEGNILKAVQCTFPHVKDEEGALDITCRSAVHAMQDFIKQSDPQGFINFWGARWAPVGATNDPHNLNANWPKNVGRLWLKVNA